MEFSSMLKRCKLSEISDYFLDLGQSLIEKEDLDYETAIRNMECRTEKLINSYFKNEDERDKFYKEIAGHDAVIRDIYFQLGFIAAVNFMKDIEKRGQELNKQKNVICGNWETVTATP